MVFNDVVLPYVAGVFGRSLALAGYDGENAERPPCARSWVFCRPYPFDLFWLLI